MIRPVLEDGSALFDNCSIGDSLKLESCQRTAAIICSGAMRRTETNLLMNMLGLESLGDRSRVSKMTLFFKIIHNQTAPYIQRNFTFTDPLTFNLRHKATINSPRCKLVAYKHSFFPNCIAALNKLPITTTNAPNTASFKREIKLYLKIENQTEHFNPLNNRTIDSSDGS